MSPAPDTDLQQRWFPLCAVEDLPPRHVLETALLEQELAVWRSAGGTVNVWTNRCPHRGMRLTLGANLGEELRCAYHGYRFAAGSGRCTAVPAHPTRTPPQNLRVTVLPALTHHGMVWTQLRAVQHAPSPPWLPPAAASIALYGLAVRAPALQVGNSLLQYRFRPSEAPGSIEPEAFECTTRRLDAYSIECVASAAGATSTVRFWTQPLDAERTMVHARLLGDLAPELRPQAWHDHAERLSRWRTGLERNLERERQR